MACNQCGEKWQQDLLPDLKKRNRITWAGWNFAGTGQNWPEKTYKEALLEAPPGLTGGQRKKKPKQGVDKGIHKALKEHWAQLPDSLKSQCTAMGIRVVEPPATPDLPSLIKEHLSSLPAELKEAVEKIVEPEKPEPTLSS